MALEFRETILISRQKNDTLPPTPGRLRLTLDAPSGRVKVVAEPPGGKLRPARPRPSARRGEADADAWRATGRDQILNPKL